MSDLIPRLSTHVDLTFSWRMRGGERVRPEVMGTNHLANTLIMIWNHAMPADARTHDYVKYRKYRFGPSYSDAYLRKAIREIALQLATRRDMLPHHMAKLNHMLNYLYRNHMTGIRDMFIDNCTTNPERIGNGV